MIGKKLRVKSQIIEIGYISPWKLQEQSSRNDLQTFLNKNQLLDETGSPLQGWTKTRISKVKAAKLQETRQKKQGREANKTLHDFGVSMRRSFHRKFYSKSTSLQKDNYDLLKESNTIDADIFAKKHRPSQRPKLVTVGNFCTTEPSEPQPHIKTLVLKNSFFDGSNLQVCRKKKKCQLKKQSLTHNLLKKQLVNHKEFISSLENCLNQIDRVPRIERTNQLLSKTLKSFLTHQKKV